MFNRKNILFKKLFPKIKNSEKIITGSKEDIPVFFGGDKKRVPHVTFLMIFWFSMSSKSFSSSSGARRARNTKEFLLRLKQKIVGVEILFFFLFFFLTLFEFKYFLVLALLVWWLEGEWLVELARPTFIHQPLPSSSKVYRKEWFCQTNKLPLLFETRRCTPLITSSKLQIHPHTVRIGGEKKILFILYILSNIYNKKM